MGWQDRDWAKFDDSELAELYGVARADPKLDRTKVWGVMAVLALATGGFAYTQLPPGSPSVAPIAAPTVIYGLPGNNASVAADSPGGLNTICSNTLFDRAAQRWVCTVWIININSARVINPAPYRGLCTHLVADQVRALWTCAATDPVPPSDLPPVPSEPGTGLSA